MFPEVFVCPRGVLSWGGGDILSEFHERGCHEEWFCEEGAVKGILRKGGSMKGIL